MPDWRERLTRDTEPVFRREHDLRYRASAPLIVAAPVWVDLGCGEGTAAAAALEQTFTGHAVLVDSSQHALDEASVTLRSGSVTAVRADLDDEDDIARVRDAVIDAGDGGCVTCFGLIEELRSFVPVLELVTALATDHGYTAVLSVPNDAFWALEAPFRRTMWGEGAFEELRRLLPAGNVVARQVPIVGSVIVPQGNQPPVELSAVEVEPERVPSHLVAAFGPRAEKLVAQASAGTTDLDEQRRWERERSSQLAFYEAEVAHLREQISALEKRLGEEPREAADSAVGARVPSAEQA